MLQFLRNILNPHTGKLDVIGFDAAVMAQIAGNLIHIGLTPPDPTVTKLWIDESEDPENLANDTYTDENTGITYKLVVVDGQLQLEEI